MKESYDVIVVGLQLAGAPILWQLAKRGLKVIGFDRYIPPHNFGSSHGDSRIHRHAIGEGDFYTEYALRSTELIKELEAETGLNIFTTTGGLIMVSDNDNSVMHGNKDFLGETIRVAEKYKAKIPGWEILDTWEIQRRFPQFSLDGDEKGYYEPTAGFLRPENAIISELRMAKHHGASIHAGEEVVNIIASTKGVKVKTTKQNYHAGKVVISAGSWVSRFFLTELEDLFEPHRQVVYYFDILSNFGAYLPGRFPIFIWQRDNKFVYGFPAIDGPTKGLKMASETVCPTDPDMMRRDVSGREVANFYNSQIKSYFPDFSKCCLKAIPCKYTDTLDRHFIIDYYPEKQNVIVISADSGHGAKHSMAVGETAAELVIDGRTTLDISPFSFKRFKI